MGRHSNGLDFIKANTVVKGRTNLVILTIMMIKELNGEYFVKYCIIVSVNKGFNISIFISLLSFSDNLTLKNTQTLMKKLK